MTLSTPVLAFSCILGAQIILFAPFYWRQCHHRLLKHQAHFASFISIISFLASYVLYSIQPSTQLLHSIAVSLQALAWCAITATCIHYHFLFDATHLRAKLQDSESSLPEAPESSECQKTRDTIQQRLRIAHERQTQRASLVFLGCLGGPVLVICSGLLWGLSAFSVFEWVAVIILLVVSLFGLTLGTIVIFRSFKSQVVISCQLSLFLLFSLLTTVSLLVYTVHPELNNVAGIIGGVALNIISFITIGLPTILSFLPSFFELDAGHLTSIVEVVRISSASDDGTENKRSSQIFNGSDGRLSLNIKKDESLADSIPYLNELGRLDSSLKRTDSVMSICKVSPMGTGNQSQKRASVVSIASNVRRSFSFFNTQSQAMGRPSFSPSVSSDVFSYNYNPFSSNGTVSSAPKQSLPTLLNASSLLQELEEGLRSSLWRRGFTRFLSQEFCVETLLFLKTGHSFQQCSQTYSIEKSTRLARYILSEFIVDSAPNQVNLPSSIRKEMNVSIEEAISASEHVPASVFDVAMLHVKQTLALNQVPRFKKSAWYKKFILSDSSVVVPDYV